MGETEKWAGMIEFIWKKNYYFNLLVKLKMQENTDKYFFMDLICCRNYFDNLADLFDQGRSGNTSAVLPGSTSTKQ